MDINLKNVVVNKDCILQMQSFTDKVFDHVITDIPYAVVSRETGGIRIFDKEHADTLVFDLHIFIDELSRVTKSNILIFCASEQVSFLNDKLSEKGYNVYLGIWEKTNPSPVNGQHFWLSGVECCIIATKETLTADDLIWRFPCGRSKSHPTEKPLKLIEFLVQKFTTENQIVFDPCAGSGSHLLALKNNNRYYYGVELFEKYYQIIKDKQL